MAHWVPTITDFARLAKHSSPRHPLVALVPIGEVVHTLNDLPRELTLGFYTIGLKKNLRGYLKYGRQQYDFQEGVLVFTAPQQTLSYDHLVVHESSGWYLFIDRAFLSNSRLGSAMERYPFFHYAIQEALHLSQEEEMHLDRIFQSLYQEYHKPIDGLSKTLLLNHLEMILTYSTRYYQRQFITRQQAETGFLARFEELLEEACHPERLQMQGLPSVQQLAQRMHWSPNYLSDALRSATGLSTQRHIHLRLVSLAKEKLLAGRYSISEVAYDLGFESPNYFSRLFKKVEGQTPKEFVRGHTD